MSVIDHIISAFECIGSIANALRRRIRYLLFAALVAAIYISSQAYAPDSVWWWNVIKCGVPLLPMLIWLLVWSALRQLGEAPAIAKELVADNDDILQHVSQLNKKQVSSVWGAYRTLKAFREQSELEDVMEAISGVGLLINPFFALLALLAFFCLFGLIVAAFLLMLF